MSDPLTDAITLKTVEEKLAALRVEYADPNRTRSRSAIDIASKPLLKLKHDIERRMGSQTGRG